MTNVGGPGVLASDSVVDYGGELVKLWDESKRILDAQLPPYWSHGNPVDVLGDADVKRYEVALKICIENPNVGGLLVIYTPQDVTPALGVAELVTKGH